MKAQVIESLRLQFRPEFLNRVDEMIVFHALTDADLAAIVDLLLADLSRAAGRPGPDARADAGRPRAHRPRGPRPGLRGAAAQADDPAPRREPVRAGAPRGPVPARRPSRSPMPTSSAGRSSSRRTGPRSRSRRTPAATPGSRPARPAAAGTAAGRTARAGRRSLARPAGHRRARTEGAHGRRARQLSGRAGSGWRLAGPPAVPDPAASRARMPR